jgi:hypothetical protein
MKRPVRHDDGMYHINGNKYKMLMGSRIQVHNKTAYKTEGGLTRDKLMMNKWGRIVSLAKHRTAKKEKRLEKAGYFAQKGKFGYVKKTARKSGKATRGSRKMKGRKMRGGDVTPEPKTRPQVMVDNPKEEGETDAEYNARIDILLAKIEAAPEPAMLAPEPAMPAAEPAMPSAEPTDQ